MYICHRLCNGSCRISRICESQEVCAWHENKATMMRIYRLYNTLLYKKTANVPTTQHLDVFKSFHLGLFPRTRIMSSAAAIYLLLFTISDTLWEVITIITHRNSKCYFKSYCAYAYFVFICVIFFEYIHNFYLVEVFSNSSLTSDISCTNFRCVIYLHIKYRVQTHKQ
jgi:hypothetical protein